MSSVKTTPGQRFRDAVAAEHPLQVVGAINANHALLAQRAGFQGDLPVRRRRGCRLSGLAGSGHYRPR